jgi:hypothetical protein
MNMNPFSAFKSKAKDKDKKLLENQISHQASVISLNIIRGRLKSDDIDQLAILYKKYFEKYPDVKGEQNSNKRLAQLRTMSKG